METFLPGPQPRGKDDSGPPCREVACHGHGYCEIPPASGTDFACVCDLGYQGDSCDETVNGSLSLPLTLGVVGFLVGIIILAFVFAKLRQTQKQRKRDLQQILAKKGLCDEAQSP